MTTETMHALSAENNRLADENERLKVEIGIVRGKNHCQSELLNQYTDENEALRAERDGLAAHAERLKNHMLGLQQSSDGVSGLHLNGDLATWDELMQGGRFEEWLLPFTETPAQSLAHIRAAGAREALERAIKVPGFSDTVVRVDVMREIIEQMEADNG